MKPTSSRRPRQKAWLKPNPCPVLLFLVLFGWSGGFAQADEAAIGHPSFLSPQARPILVHQERLFVANTAADTVDIIDTKTRKVIGRVDVGVDPVSLAIRPDGRELWVANHISDSISVIDIDKNSPSHLVVVATVQDLDIEIRSTRFDEPVGIAFANDEKAYVALSSENKIAVVDVRERHVDKWLDIPAQDPRAIVVRDERLYVIPFESNNKTQLSGGYKIDGDLVTFNAHEHSIAHNNVLSLGHVLDIIKHPRVPDRDLFVFDTETDKLLSSVDTLGTLLYGLTVDSKGRVFVAQTDARNDANGRSGTKKHGLAELENRPFLNQITRVDFDGKVGTPAFFDLEPLPPKHPEPAEALATPFAIQISNDDRILVATAAASDRLFTVDAETGEVLGRVTVGAVPRGIALQSDAAGAPARAWVLNVVDNTVSVIDLEEVADPKHLADIVLDDPTHPVFKRGRIAFNTAKASTTKTFACAGCHPDGHTDQLLWVLKTPIVSGGKQIMPRSTMPLRGLRETAPFHWDGIPGDPYGGNNSANIRGHVDPNCELDDPVSAPLHLVDGSLATTMLGAHDESTNDEDKAGFLSAAERDDLAKFLLAIPFPPAQRRAYDNQLSAPAKDGFELFHILGNHEGKPKPNVCGDCHRMPFWVSSNTPGTGMDAPTWRGAYDRFLILPQGRLNIIDFDFYRRVAEKGIPERDMWRFSWRSKPRFDPVWNMVLEGSTGVSGSFARQLTLNRATADTPLSRDLLSALETSAREGAVLLEVNGILPKEEQTVRLLFRTLHNQDVYVERGESVRSFTREELVALAQAGNFVGTFTARHGIRDDYDDPQPALWTLGELHAQRGRQKFPVLYGEQRSMTLQGRHILPEAHVVVNGRKVQAEIELLEEERIRIRMRELPPVGMHFLQLQNRSGLFSNDFIFHVAANESKATAIAGMAKPHRLNAALDGAIRRNDLAVVKRLLKQGAPVNARHGEGGTRPLSVAALHGHLEIATVLIDKGARPSLDDNDGNTPLHIAAFLCHTDVVDLLLKHNAKLDHRNDRRETVADVVSGEWSEGLAAFYNGISRRSSLDLDLDTIKQQRPKLAQRFRQLAKGSAAKTE